MNEPKTYVDQLRERKEALEKERDRLLAENAKTLKFSVVMISIDRDVDGKENYASTTLENFERAGAFSSDCLASFNILVGSSPSQYDYIFCSDGQPWYPEPIYASRRLLPCENAGHALIDGGLSALRSGSDFVLFLEDDLDFCSSFLESCAAWLSSRAEDADRYRLFSFGCAYPQIVQLFEQQSLRPDLNILGWNYPVTAFYGTQCFAIRPQDALSLGTYLQSNPDVRGVKSPGAYDLMIHDWMRLTYPDPAYSHFLASVPSFVQHIGRQSICTGVEKPHIFPSWPGREWSFVK